MPSGPHLWSTCEKEAGSFTFHHLFIGNACCALGFEQQRPHLITCSLVMPAVRWALSSSVHPLLVLCFSPVQAAQVMTGAESEGKAAGSMTTTGKLSWNDTKYVLKGLQEESLKRGEPVLHLVL
jgi:hypothetical protein